MTDKQRTAAMLDKAGYDYLSINRPEGSTATDATRLCIEFDTPAPMTVNFKFDAAGSFVELSARVDVPERATPEPDAAA